MCSSRTLRQRPPPDPGPDPVQLRDERRVGREQELARRREAQQLPVDLGRLAGREQDRLAHVGVDVGEHRGAVRERADVRVAGVEQHDRRGAEPLAEQEAQRGRVDERQVEVRVAQAGVELDRHVLAGGLLDRDDDQVVEERLRLDPDAALGQPRGPGQAIAVRCVHAQRRRHVQPGAVGDHGLQADDAATAEVAQRGAVRVEEVIHGLRFADQPLDQRLEPQDLLDPARSERPQLLERVRRVGAVAGVDQPRLEVAALDDRPREPLDAALPARRVDGFRRRLAAEQRGHLDERVAVEQRVLDVVPGDLRDVRLGQVDPERVVVGRLLAEERVAMVVDDRDRVEVEGQRSACLST